MAIDEAIFKMVADGKSAPTLRFYSWDPPAVSVGYFQDSLNEIDLAACRKMGIDVVRRLTGGRAVLHDRELTYSLICREDVPHFPESVIGTYKVISSCLVKGLKSLGIDAMLTPSVRPSYRTPSPSSPPLKGGERGINYLPWRERVRVRGNKTAPSACFSSPSHYEITVSGNKLVGSAQRRGEGVFLQHGSILMEFDRGRLEKVLPASGNLDCITSISEHIRVGTDELIASLVKGFEDRLGISFSEGSLSEEEMSLSGRYAEEKYSRPEWNFRRGAA